MDHTADDRNRCSHDGDGQGSACVNCARRSAGHGQAAVASPRLWCSVAGDVMAIDTTILRGVWCTLATACECRGGAAAHRAARLAFHFCFRRTDALRERSGVEAVALSRSCSGARRVSAWPATAAPPSSERRERTRWPASLAPLSSLAVSSASCSTPRAWRPAHQPPEPSTSSLLHRPRRLTTSSMLLQLHPSRLLSTSSSSPGATSSAPAATSVTSPASTAMSRRASYR